MSARSRWKSQMEGSAQAQILLTVSGFVPPSLFPCSIPALAILVGLPVTCAQTLAGFVVSIGSACHEATCLRVVCSTPAFCFGCFCSSCTASGSFHVQIPDAPSAWSCACSPQPIQRNAAEKSQMSEVKCLKVHQQQLRVRRQAVPDLSATPRPSMVRDSPPFPKCTVFLCSRADQLQFGKDGTGFLTFSRRAEAVEIDTIEAGCAKDPRTRIGMPLAPHGITFSRQVCSALSPLPF